MSFFDEPEMIIDYKSYRWIVSSCFQKSLRRGRFDLAQTYLRFLWEHERSYITYRLGTILTEDVGIGNLPLVNRYLATKLAKKKIDEAGGLDFLLEITQEACQSVKDRSSCDLAHLANFYSLDLPSQLQATEDDKITYLSQLFGDKKQSYITRLQAGWIMLGQKKFKHEGLSFIRQYPFNEKGEMTDDLIAYREMLVSHGFDAEIITTFEDAYATQSENMSLGVPLIYSLFQDELKNDTKTGRVIVGQSIEHMYVKETTIHQNVTGLDLISSGIDGHTREGKSAYNMFLKGDNHFTYYMKEKNIAWDMYMLIFSHCMFRVEGHEVNKRLYFPSAVNIMRDCEQLLLDIKTGMSGVLDFATIKKLIIADMPIINQLRSQQIQRAITPMIEKPVPKTKRKKDIK